MTNYVGKKIIALCMSFGLLLSVLSTLTACSSDDGTNKAISYSLTSEPRNLDPQMASDNNSLLVIRNIFEGLTRFDADGSIIPGVAEEWSNNADYTEYTFRLRHNAKWSDEEGTPVTARDFVFAWQRALDPATHSTTCSQLFPIKNARSINEGKSEKQSLGVTVIDDYTLKVSMEYPYKEFVLQTPNAVFMPCHQAFFESTNGHYGLDFNTDSQYILSNGPFKITKWSHDNYVRTIRNENYAGYHTVSPRVLYFGIRSSDTNYFSLLENETVESAVIATEDIAKLKDTEYQYTTVTDTTWGFLFNLEKPAIGLTAVRRAFMACVSDKDEKGHSLLPYGFEAANDIIPPSTHINGHLYRELAGGGFKETYDPSEARSSLLKALESVELSRMPNLTLICPDDEEIKNLMYSIMRSWQENLYVYANIEPLDMATLQSRISLGNYQIAFYPIAPTKDDPLNTLSRFTSDSSSNPAFLKHPAYDKLVAQASSRSNTEDILAPMAAAEKYLCTYVIFYPVYYEVTYFVMRPNVSGIYFSPFDGAADFTNCRFAE
ncbi:MAG: peptide ABC transporter substrate-binding protein [Clostridia bacterium]|nr:peptide ABC transporter substrate-binding protein [Clostridia bacterium]